MSQAGNIENREIRMISPDANITLGGNIHDLVDDSPVVRIIRGITSRPLSERVSSGLARVAWEAGEVRAAFSEARILFASGQLEGVVGENNQDILKPQETESRLSRLGLGGKRFLANIADAVVPRKNRLQSPV